MTQPKPGSVSHDFEVMAWQMDFVVKKFGQDLADTINTFFPGLTERARADRQREWHMKRQTAMQPLHAARRRSKGHNLI